MKNLKTEINHIQGPMFILKQKFKQLPLYEKIFQASLVLLLLVSAGFPLFKSKGLDIAIFCYTLSGVIYFKANLRKSLSFIAFFGALMIIQTCYFGETYIRTALHQMILFTGGAFSVSILGTNFLYIYQRIIYFFSVVSLVFFIPILINNDFLHILISHFPISIETTDEFYGLERVSYNIFFMNFPPDFFQGLIRNSGPFWEPGAFGGFLILSLMINTFFNNSIINRPNILLIVTILSTFSTTTYLALFFFISAFYFMEMKDRLLQGLIVVIFSIAFYLAFYSLSFLGPKIDRELDEIEYEALMFGGNSRSASAYLDLIEITEKPFYIIFGRGSHPDTRVKGTDKEVLRNNGLTDMLSRIGVIFFIFYMYTLRRSFEAIGKIGSSGKHLSYIALITFCILAFSETYLKFSFFWGLILFQTWNPGRKDSSENSSGLQDPSNPGSVIIANQSMPLAIP